MEAYGQLQSTLWWPIRMIRRLFGVRISGIGLGVIAEEKLLAHMIIDGENPSRVIWMSKLDPQEARDIAGTMIRLADQIEGILK